MNRLVTILAATTALAACSWGIKLDSGGSKVRTGYEAPMEYQIFRQSVWDAIKRENRQAAAVQPRAGAAREPAEQAEAAQ